VEVVPGSPAAQGGLKTGDVVTELNGQPIVDSRRLKLAVGDIRPGKDITMKVLRDEKNVDVKLTVGDQPKDRSSLRRSSGEQGDNDLKHDDQGTLNGVGVADLDAQSRREFGIPAKVQGVLVTEVDPTSKAAEAGVQPGDVIQEINRQPVHSAEEAVKMTENPATKKTLLRVWSERGTRYIVVDETETETK
jgi:serine protease Do